MYIHVQHVFYTIYNVHVHVYISSTHLLNGLHAGSVNSLHEEFLPRLGPRLAVCGGQSCEMFLSRLHICVSIVQQLLKYTVYVCGVCVYVCGVCVYVCDVCV